MIRLRVQDNGDKWWWNNRTIHRANGPAIISYSGQQLEWWFNDKRHRLDGPAVKLADSKLFWFINNQLVTEYEYMFLVNQGLTND